MKRIKEVAGITTKHLLEIAFKELVKSGLENTGLESIAEKAELHAERFTGILKIKMICWIQ